MRIPGAGITESIVEFRLFSHLHRCLREQMGLLPSHVDWASVWHVLDVACGAGYWLQDMAREHQDMLFVGLDRSEDVVALADLLKDPFRLDHVAYTVGDMRKMDFTDSAFDLVHARFLASVVSPRTWFSLMQELLRVCRPGGLLVWTEGHRLQTNSSACFSWWCILQQALANAGYTPEVVSAMEMLLRDMRCQHVKKIETLVDLSAGTELHTCAYPDVPMLLSAVQPFLLRNTFVAAAELEALAQEIIIDLYKDDFRATWAVTTVTAQKLPLDTQF